MLGGNTAIIPLAVLAACPVLGGLAIIWLTRKITRARLQLELQIREAEEELLGQKPVLVDIFLGSQKSQTKAADCDVSWAEMLPLAANVSTIMTCPHPHHIIEKRSSYQTYAYADGNIIETAVCVKMPTPPLDPSFESEKAPHFEIGTTDVVVCTLRGARQRLVGIN